MPFDLALPPPAIIEFQETHEVHFGLSYAPSRTELDRFIVPRDWRDATIDELRAYIPADIREMPEWAIRGMFPLFARKAGGKKLIRTTVFLTSTSGSNQSWNVLDDWNSAENIVHVIGGGGSGAGIPAQTGNSQRRGGGGGGGYAHATNIVLTPNGSATYRLGPLATVGTGAGGAGSDCWFNGTSLAASSVGAKGGNGSATGTGGGSGGSGTSGVGSTRYSGGNGSAATGNGGNSGAGGGAGGPGGNGNNASGTTGGSGGAGSGGSSGGGAGTEFQASPAYGSGGGANAQTFGQAAGQAGGNYGGGGAGARGPSGAFGPAYNGGQGAQGLIVIINNHINGV